MGQYQKKKVWEPRIPPISRVSVEGAPIGQIQVEPRLKPNRTHRRGDKASRKTVFKQFENGCLGYLRHTGPKPTIPRLLNPGDVKTAQLNAEKRFLEKPNSSKGRFIGRDSKRANLIYTQPDHNTLVSSINNQTEASKLASEARRFTPKFIIRRAGDQDPKAPQ